jgi:queuosine precursor transporter
VKSEEGRIKYPNRQFDSSLFTLHSSFYLFFCSVVNVVARSRAENFFFVMVGALCDAIPGAPYWDNEEGFHAIFGLAPRIAAASFIAFICGSFINAYVMSKMKIASNGKNFSLRAILSTVAGESIDSLIFFPLALSSVVPAKELILLMVWQVILKTVYEIIALPITIRVVKALKKYEGEDVYDEGINYGWFKF